MNLPEPKYRQHSQKRYFVPIIVKTWNYIVMLKCNQGYPPTMEDPGENSEIELEKIFDANGVDISDKVSDKDWEQLNEWFNNPPKKQEISFDNDKIIL